MVKDAVTSIKYIYVLICAYLSQIRLYMYAQSDCLCKGNTNIYIMSCVFIESSTYILNT